MKHINKTVLFPLLLIILINLSCKNEVVLTEEKIDIQTYEEDFTIFPNPERGMYIHKQFDHSGVAPIRTSELISQREFLGYTMVLTIYYLGEFMNGPINDQMLSLIEENMRVIRECGFKAILRFAYSQSENASVYDAHEDITLNHIAQLAPVIQDNIDVVAVFQAGFVGAWGEWWYSTHYGNENNPDYNKRKRIVDALLEVLPEDRMVSMRTPAHKTKVLNISYSDSITRAEAFNGSEKARLGHHNDCFLADANDMGTYPSVVSRIYTASDSKYTCMGGETCAPSSFAECQKAINEMGKYHWSYLNKDYNRLVLNDWKQKGCYDEVQRRLGYRLVLRSAENPKIHKQGDRYKIKFIFDNIGFAAPYNPYMLKLHFRNAEGQIVYQHISKQNPRSWFGGETIQINEEIELPALPKGIYDVLLSITDANVRLSDNPAYSIRFANVNVWDKDTGYNMLLKQTIE